jgi:hypothetical protein
MFLKDVRQNPSGAKALDYFAHLPARVNSFPDTKPQSGIRDISPPSLKQKRRASAARLLAAAKPFRDECRDSACAGGAAGKDGRRCCHAYWAH